ncbi:MAG TPA: cation diffusion facilitator family transporter [Herpetosiphonaceae bacterium]
MQTARSYTFFSIAAAIITIGLKFSAYLLTGSIGLYSDAAESVVNLIAALVALWALTLAARPPDDEHAYGHTKAEYFSSGLEGALILVAAASIGFSAWNRIWHPQPLEQVGLGLALSIVSAAVNGSVALVLMRAGKRLRSITLEADAHHLLTDVWTTAGVVVGVLLVQWTGWLVLDSLIAIVVAVNIVWTGLRLLRETGYGLLDTALSLTDQRIINDVLETYENKGIVFHALRTRLSGTRRFVSMHVLVPGSWTVQQGHDLCEEIELAIRRELLESTIMTHLEPLEDPAAWEDLGLDRVVHRAASH